MATPKWCFLRNKMIDSYFWGSSNENIPKHRLNFSSMAGCHQHLPNHFWVTLILKPNHSKQGWVAFPTHNWWIVWKLSVARKMIDMLPIPEGRGWIFLVRKVGISKQTRIQPNLWSFKNITHEKNMTSLTLPATIFFILLHFDHQIPVFVVGCNYFLHPPHQHRDVVKKNGVCGCSRPPTPPRSVLPVGPTLGPRQVSPGGFLTWWVSPTTMGFSPTKNHHFGMWNGGTTILGNKPPYHR